MKQKLPELNEEIDKSTITLAYSNIPFPIIVKKKMYTQIYKITEDLNNPVNHRYN